jgi:AcrR family transcriptional regulator
MKGRRRAETCLARLEAPLGALVSITPGTQVRWAGVHSEHHMPARSPARARPRRSAERTITKFLLAAEQIYGEHGYEGTTIRAIAKRARANLGTLQHYWGSKRELFRDLFETRFRPLQQEHLEQLRQIEERHSDGSQPPVMEVLQTLIETTFSFGGDLTLEHVPGIEPSEARRRFQTLYGRALMDPSPEVLAEISKIFEKPVKLFLALMRRACPQLSAAELDWRVNCIIGAQVFSLVYRERLGIFFGAEADVDSARAAKWMLHFLMNGIDAPALPVDRLPSKGNGRAGEQLKLTTSHGERQTNAAPASPFSSSRAMRRSSR